MSDDEDLDQNLSLKNSPPVELGYVEEVGENKLRLHSAFFCSKIGGKPAWLGLNPLPKSADLVCGICSDPLIFLAQIYAPISFGPGQDDTAFHRTLFVFLCRNADCSKEDVADNFRVFRSQLARKNKFYSDEALVLEEVTDESSLPSPSSHSINLCNMCGCPASKKCARCLHAWYCTQTHQIADWKGRHKELCGRVKEEGRKVLKETGNNSLLFPEFELVTETEELQDIVEEERTESARLAEYRKYLEEVKGGSKPTVHVDEECDEDMVKKEDTYFKKFRDIVDQNPEQVVRYCRGGLPLWVHPYEGGVPNCQKCGAKRVYELQIMPHLLQVLELDSVEK